MDKTLEATHIEAQDEVKPQIMGNVKLLQDGETVLVPTPSPDPNDPLNLPSWRKWAILVLVAAYGCSAVVLASGLGPIFTTILASYPGEELKANDLLTYPTLFMGVGNVIAMPLAMAIGRRPIFLASILVMVVGGIWCAFAPNLDMHIAGRNIMSLAAGQSEALAPLIVQEIHFLHERGRKLAWFGNMSHLFLVERTFYCPITELLWRPFQNREVPFTISDSVIDPSFEQIFTQNVSNCVFFITSTYMTSAWGWRWWYGFFTIFSAVILAFSFVLVSETEFDRPADASTGQVHLDFNAKGELEKGGDVHKLVQVTTRHGTVLEPERYGARTWKRDMRLVNIKPRWHLVLPHYKHIAQGLCIPTIFWLLIVNGAWLGMYVFTAGTFATILVPPPYGFAFNSLGYVQAGQIVCFMIFLPLAGYGSDWVIKRLSMRNYGVFKPEYRLTGLALPAVVGVIAAVVYGQAAQRPTEWHWSAIVVNYNAVNFAFNCVNLVGITYAVESFPQRAASLLVVICAGRGIISFGLSYSTLPAINAIGYDGALNIQAGIGGGLTALAIGVWFVGPRIRALAAKWFNMEESD